MSAAKVKRVVGKYELGRTIGEGTFAKVKFARSSQTGDPVAIKILDKEKVLKNKMAEQVYFSFLVSDLFSGWRLFYLIFSLFIIQFICNLRDMSIATGFQLTSSPLLYPLPPNRKRT